MTDFEKTYQNYNPRAAALAEARALLTEAAKAAMADGTLPEAELPAFIVEIPADTKNGDIASNLAMARLEAMSPFLVSAGISTIKAGSSASGRVPSAIAALAASVSRARASASAAARGL